jgi:glycine/D-amino acid oxidase-like deaminating enzyme
MRALSAWQDWEGRAGQELIARNGAVVLGLEAQSFATAMHSAGAPFDWHGQADELEDVLPASLLGVGPALRDRAGGTIHAEAAIAMLLANLGDRVVRDVAHALRFTASGVIIETAGGHVEAEKVIVAAGNDTAGLVKSIGIKLPSRTFAHARFTLRWSAPLDLPIACFLDRRRETSSGWSFYGVPLDSERLAIGGGWADAPFPTSRFNARHVRDASWEALTAWVSANAPDLELRELDRVDCEYTREPEHAAHPYRIEQRGSLVTVTGHDLFKFAPLLARDLCARLQINAEASSSALSQNV